MGHGRGIDAKLKADGSALRMIQEDKPKKGETGYVDGTVFYAYTRLAVLLRKPVGQLTENDITNNPVQVQRAIDDALTYRRVTKMGDYTLSYADDTGNKVYLWCLKANANHGGPDLGLLYVPNGKTPATLVVTMPDNTIPVASGSNPDWILLTPNEPTTLFQYNGSAPTTISVGDIIAGVAMVTPAPRASSSPPTSTVISPPPSTPPTHTTG